MMVAKLVLLVSVLLVGNAFAQFSGPAFDEDVFIPEKGPDIDVLFGPFWDVTGWNLHNLGPAPGGVDDRIAYTGYYENPLYHTIFDAKPPFLLSNLKVIQQTNVKFPEGTIFGNFHSARVKDALVMQGGRPRPRPVIYWADENGFYDSTRRTYLGSTIRAYNNTWFYFDVTNAYVAEFTSDSLDDIVLGGSAKDSTFMLLYEAGFDWMLSDTIFQDTSCYFDIKFRVSDQSYRFGTVADFRGSGRKDYLASDTYGNWFLYKNDPPFKLENFAASMHNDTLLTTWQNPNLDEYEYPYIENRFTMQALPRPWWDKSVDFMPRLKTDDWRSKCIAIFRGGPHFGEHRLTLDSAETYLRYPGLLDPTWESLLGINPYLDAGDMTGTGNPVLMVGAGFNGYQTYNFFYTLGRAIDDKIDMVITHNYTSLSNDQISLHAGKDKYQDVLMGAYVRKNDQDPYPGRPELWLLHGTNQIPAKLNPKYAVPAFYSPEQGLSVYPNPAREKITFTYSLKTPSNAVLTFQDVLGRVVWTTDFYAESGVQSVDLKLPEFVAGTYVLVLRCGSETLSAKLIIH